MIEEFKNIKSTKKELREFGLVVGGVLLALGLFAIYKDRPWGEWSAGIGGALIALGLILPSVLIPFQKIWMALAVVLGAVMSRLVLALLFFLVLTPIALLARLTGKSFLTLNIDKNADTYWISRTDDGQTKQDSERQF